MMEQILLFANSALLLIFGVYLSAAFAGINFTKRNVGICFAICVFSGILQIALYIAFSEALVWQVYPLITHLPLLIMLSCVYHKKVVTSVVAVCTAYLCCHPAKWFGVLVYVLTKNISAQYFARIGMLVVIGSVAFRYFAEVISEISNKETRNVLLFGITPIVYYIYDYSMVVYTDFFTSNNRVVIEFLPFFLGIVFMMFCLLYYKEYERKNDAERKEQIISITVEEQKKEINAVKRSEQEIRILRHDMRLLLNNLLVCIDNEDKTTAKKMISAYVDTIEATAVKRYCSNTTINYIVSSFAHKCNEAHTQLITQIEFDSLNCDEIMLSTIISNALDNALNAQKYMPQEDRKIKMMLKNYNGKLLLSVKNPFSEKPVFADGVPISNKKGHGYGTQSIICLAERMGGNCQFTTEGNIFVLRIVV